MTPAEIAAAEAALAVAAARYLTLSESDWRAAGSTAEARDEGAVVKTTKVHAPVPINPAVVDWLLETDLAAVALSDAVTTWLAGSPATESDEQRAAGARVRAEREAREAGVRAWYGRTAVLPERAPGGAAEPAFTFLAKALPSLPDDLAEDVAGLAYRLSRTSARLLGLEQRRRPITTCPACRTPSVILSPTDDDLALCVNRYCAVESPEAAACACRRGGLDAACDVPGGCGSLPGIQPSWRRSAGEWTALGAAAEALALLPV